MNELLGINESSGRRFRLAFLVSATSLSVMFGAAPVEAWNPLSSGQKTADDEAAKSNKGFDSTIRQLMAEAKAQEEMGNLDRAIVLADRANSVAESSSSVTKPGKEVSPAMTSQYAKELRKKRAAQIARQPAKKPETEKTALEKLTTTKPVAAKLPFEQRAVARPGSDTLVADNTENEKPKRRPSSNKTPLPDAQTTVSRPEKRFEQKTASTDSQARTPDARNAAANSDQSRPRKAVAPDQSGIILISNEDDFDEPTPKETAPSRSKNAPADTDMDRTSVLRRPTDAEVTKKNSKPSTESRITISPKRSNDRSVTTDQFPEVNPMPTGSKSETSAQAIPKTGAGKVKLRREYNSNSSEARRPIVVPTQTTSSFDDEPTISPMTDPAVPPQSRTEPNRIRISLDDEKPVTAVDVDASKVTTKESRSADANEEFPAQKVVELKKRLDSAISLEPGAVAPVRLTAHNNDSMDEVDENEFGAGNRSVRLRKRKHSYRETPSTATESNGTEESPQRTSRQPVIGKTSMIQWRGAKDESTERSASAGPSSRPSRVPNDLRQSLGETTGSAGEVPSAASDQSLFTRPSVALSRTSRSSRDELPRETLRSERPSSRAQLRGSLWDNATSPSLDGYSGSIDGASKTIRNGPSVSLEAPLPPPDINVEQTSFDSPSELYNRRTRQPSSQESPATVDREEWSDPTLINDERDTSSENSMSNVRPKKSSSNDTLDEKTASSREALTNGPVERLASAMGISVSTASAILGAVGFAMFIAGLWVVRATLRTSESSPHVGK